MSLAFDACNTVYEARNSLMTALGFSILITAVIESVQVFPTHSRWAVITDCMDLPMGERAYSLPVKALDWNFADKSLLFFFSTTVITNGFTGSVADSEGWWHQDLTRGGREHLVLMRMPLIKRDERKLQCHLLQKSVTNNCIKLHQSQP